MATQFARAAGAATVVGVVGDNAQVDYARNFGLDAVVTGDEFPQAVGDETFDVILDPIGGQKRERNIDVSLLTDVSSSTATSRPGSRSWRRPTTS